MAGQIWLISDMHLWHENLYRFTYTDAQGNERRVRERFTHAAESDAYMLQRWRDLIRPQDHVYNLGDLCMNRENHMAHAFVELFRSLPGHKRLILGNHDHLKPKWYVEAGFEKLRGGHVIDRLLLTHYPVHPSSINFRALGNVHGHTHQQPDLGPRYLNVCVERTDYAPIPIEEAKSRLQRKISLAETLGNHLFDVSGVEVTGP